MAQKVTTCCCCGQALPPKNPFVPRSPIKARIYDFISKHPEGVTRFEIMDYAYADDPEGGAEGQSIISVHVKQMNDKVLKPMGCMIRSTMGHGAVYGLLAI